MVDLYLGLIFSIPELIIAAGALSLILLGVFLNDRAYPIVTGLSVTVLVACVAWIVLFSGNGLALSSSFVVDPFARFMKGLIILSAIGTLILSVGFSKTIKVEKEKFEYPILVLFATLGMMLVVSSNDMLSVYLALELQSLSLYVITAMDRNNVRSSEAGLKYFILGSLSSGMLLYGISLIYGYTGHTGFENIAIVLKEASPNIGLIFGLVFLLAGLVFKVSSAPFHMWTPDVYEGAPIPVTAFLATASKVTGFALLMRIMMSVFPSLLNDWQPILVFLALFSMFVGAFGAIAQKNIKRMIAYSSIGQMGYPLAALATGTQIGLEAVVTYIVIYLITTLGFFSFLISIQKHDKQVDQIQDLAGLSSSSPFIATIMTALMFSFAGIPPLAGFWAKWSILLPLIDNQFYFVSVFAVLASVVSAFYYLRIIRIMWFQQPDTSFAPMAGELKLVMLISGFFVVFYILFSDILNIRVETAVKAFF